ncbi:alpha/beta hydrolase [Amycolatopsis samaneae]|uniref:Alpha/beta hydrolase n=1 Tax=Amycolatopsis samaneae TaxID=664691 RepID=A0ABW5GUR6_9PSEU
MRWRHRGFPRRAGTVVLTVLAVALLAAPARATAPVTSCREVAVPVAVPLLGGQTVRGTLCVPEGARVVQVLIPGATFNRAYWDYDAPGVRSYRRAMNDAGYATLAMDRLGSGRSSRPLGALLTSTGQAIAAHQVIQALRSGALGQRFDKVISGGHSLGSVINMIEASTFGDVDGVLITDMTHRLNVVPTLPVFASLIPVALDPRLSRRQGLDPAYLTTRDGTRYDSFQKPGPYNPAAARLDEETKDVVAAGEVVDAAAFGVVVPVTRGITVPVMLVMGEYDPVFCGALATDCSTAEGLLRTEGPYYSPAADLRTFVVPGFGHAINLAPDAPEYFAAVTRWADGVIGH